MARGETGRRSADYVAKAHRSYGFSGTVLAARDGQVRCAVVVGTVGGEPDVPLQTTTLFEIASATKPFAAMAALVLEEQGMLKLDDSIADYLPGVAESCRGITVAHLIQHTSGIPGTNSYGSGKDLSVVLPRDMHALTFKISQGKVHSCALLTLDFTRQ